MEGPPLQSASFLIDAFFLLPLCGYFAARISNRFHISSPCLLGLALASFWIIAGGLYFDRLDFPFLGEAGRGNHFMWNSGIEILGFTPLFAFPRPTYEPFFSLPNLFALVSFLFIYPAALYLGFRAGQRDGA